ncbi:MAG: Stp1/IreP family PP2C-type Ser/Thr phosphatase, partial [Ilumatobacteraceae bacterium]
MAELRWGSATDSGQLRPQNEDQHLATPALFVVADGMGGHQAGEIASQLAIERLQSRLSSDGSTMSDVVSAIGDANGDIYRAAIANPDQQGMGTTVTSLAVVSDPTEGEVFALANVGDSRTYLVRHGKLRQLTIDHSYVQELVAEGHISRDEARSHPRRNIVTRALGIESAVRVDSWTMPIVRGDRFVLCSDGLVDEVLDDEIARVLIDTQDPQRAADELVRVANANGGHDNITVVVVDVLEGLDPPDPTQELDVIPAWAPPQPSTDPDVDTGEYEPVMIPPSVQVPAGAPADDDADVPILVPRKRGRLFRFIAVVGIAAVLI